MKSFAFTLAAQQPLAVSWAHEIAFYQTSQEYVTGTALRGALATAWLADHGSGSPYFEDIFEGRVCFEGAAPHDYRIVPLSVRMCKYKPTSDCETWHVDDAEKTKQADGQNLSECKFCGGATEYSKGGMAGPYEDRDNQLRGQRVRTAIDPDTGSSKKGALYTQQALNGGLFFNGRITRLDTLSDDARDVFSSWFTTLKGKSIRLGRGRSVMGEAKVTDIREQDEETPNVSPGLHILRCRTPLILLDDAGRATTQISFELVRHGVKTPVVREWTRPVLVGGWHGVSGLPKPTDYALVAGTTYVIDVHTDEVEAWLKILAYGLGYRRREGFGALDFDPEPWSPPPKREQPTSGAVEDPVREAVNQIFVALRAEQGTDANQPEGINQIRDLLKLLSSTSQGARDAITELDKTAFWMKRSRKVREARDELIRVIHQGSARDNVQKALNYLSRNFRTDKSGGE